MKKGDRITITNYLGQLEAVEVVRINRKTVTVRHLDDHTVSYINKEETE